MFWADKIAEKLKKRNLPLEWVDDMKTPSGRIHVGSLRAVTTHDLLYKALISHNINAKFTYVFEDHDPMDDLPNYLPKEKYEKYLGMPLFMVPSPEKGADNFAQYYASEFEKGFNQIGCNPEIIWTTDLYFSGKMNDAIKKCLDKAGEIRKFYEELYGKKMPDDWYPFNVYCSQCNKVATTKVTGWDGKKVAFECRVEGLDWTKGCGHIGKVSPFATEDKINGKLPWKVEWAAKWQAIGVTVEGAGKDHMTKGGSHDLSSQVAEKILNYKTPFAFTHEFFLVGGRKMSTSKGRGISVIDLMEILPPQLIRFLIAKTNLNQAINFDPAESETIPNLFDEYQEYAKHYFEEKGDDYARIFELSQIGDVQKPPQVRFRDLAQWVQTPNMKDKIKSEKAQLWEKYAKKWAESFAPEKDNIMVKDEIPESAQKLSPEQKKYLAQVSELMNKEWEDAELFQKALYETGKETGLSGKEAFSSIYQALIGKNYGPKAAELILALDREFVIKRFKEVASI